jgi:hypothetical protein
MKVGPALIFTPRPRELSPPSLKEIVDVKCPDPCRTVGCRGSAHRTVAAERDVLHAVSVTRQGDLLFGTRGDEADRPVRAPDRQA